jgi:hypothetical protein
VPLYIIEREFAEQLDLSGEDVRLIEDVNADEGVSWVFTSLTADRRRSYCLYEAPVARGDHGRRRARRDAGLGDHRGHARLPGRGRRLTRR